MPDGNEGEDREICQLCRQGDVIKRSEEMSFHQWTDRGYVFCRVTIPLGVCRHCGMKSWDEAAEAIIEQAVRQEYEKLL
jgi:hypothetical protein